MKKNIIKTFLQGLAMGTVDIIPGISGGTLALILNIYSKILEQIKLINLDFLKKIIQLKIKDAFKPLDLKFIIPLILGISSALISLARVISWALSNYPGYLYSFFIGLILVSSILLFPRGKFKINGAITFLIGFILAFLIAKLQPIESSHTYFNIFISGAIAICAMILPGISGSFILIILGKYDFMLSLLHNPLNNILPILIFVLGCIIGLLSFSRVLNFLLKKYYQITLITLIGFMLGSLKKIWPSQYLEGQEIFPALGFMITGIIIGFLINKGSRNKKTGN
ncbi:MAG: DUF368 domain-containing protein [Patescibacteria group bacterium]|jgi:putative membrane protein